MRRPLLGLVLCYMAGIGLGSQLPVSHDLALVVALGLLAVFVAAHRTRLALPTLLALVFATGVLGIREIITPAAPHHLNHFLAPGDQWAGLHGVVVSDLDTADDRKEPGRQRFTLAVTALRLDNAWQPATGRVLVYAQGTRFRYGDVVDCEATLRLPRPATNPGEFDQRAWLARQGIHWVAHVRDPGLTRIVARDRGNWLVAWSLRLRDRLEGALRRGLEDVPEVSGVLAAIVLGQRTELTPATHADCQRTGVFHIFAVSGLHVGLVAVIVVGALRLVQVPRRWCALLAIPILAAYVFATGGRPGAVRAWLMASVWLGSWVFTRPLDLLNSLAAAALGMLWWNPLDLFNGGFILSFGVVTALITLTPPLDRWLTARLQPDPLVPRPLLPRWRRWLVDPLKYLQGLVAGSTAAWVGLVPLMAIYFNLFTPIALVANLVVVPLVGFIITLGMGALLADPIWPWLAATFNNANYLLLHLLLRSIEELRGVPGAYYFVQAPPPVVTLGYYAALALLFTRWRKWLWLLVPVAVLAWWWIVRVPVVELTVLDVPRGTAILVNTPGQQDDWLLDGAGRGIGSRTVLPFLRAQGVDRLAGVVVTHKNSDHVSGLAEVMAEVPVGRVLMSGANSRSQPYWTWRAFLNDRSVPVETVVAGQQWTVRGVRFRVLNPPRQQSTQRGDDNALVLLVEYGPTRVLLLSSAGATAEQQFTVPRVDVLVKGAHDAEPGANDALLAIAQPAVVVQVVNTGVSRRFVDEGLRERVERHGGQLWRTDETGAVTIRLTPTGYQLERFRKTG